MISDTSYSEWQDLAADPARAVRALTDWTADIATVMRAVAPLYHRLGGLADSREGHAFRHVERAHVGLAAHANSGTARTVVTMNLLATWASLPDRDRLLRTLADELARLLFMLNVASGGPGMWWLASSEPDTPYWHVERAHIAVLTLLTGDHGDAVRLHDLWSDNHADTAWNLRVLADQKRAESVVMTVAADGNTATIALPDGREGTAGRVGAAVGTVWVNDTETGTIVGHAPAWAEAGALLAARHGYHPNTTPVIVDYATDDTSTDTSGT